jgi:hypothetical protein
MINGKMRCQTNLTRSTKGIDFSISHMLFVDDTAIAANMSDELTVRGEELYHHFHKFGLLMHVGEKDKNNKWQPYKSEAMYCPRKT